MDSEGTRERRGSHDRKWEGQLGLFPGKPQGLLARVEGGGGGSDEGKGRREGKGERREGGEGGGENRGSEGREERQGEGEGKEERGPVGRGCSEEKGVLGAEYPREPLVLCPQLSRALDSPGHTLDSPLDLKGLLLFWGAPKDSNMC